MGKLRKTAQDMNQVGALLLGSYNESCNTPSPREAMEPPSRVHNHCDLIVLPFVNLSV